MAPSLFVPAHGEVKENALCLSNRLPHWPFLTTVLYEFLPITFLMSLFTASYDKIQQPLKYGCLVLMSKWKVHKKGNDMDE